MKKKTNKKIQSVVDGAGRATKKFLNDKGTWEAYRHEAPAAAYGMLNEVFNKIFEIAPNKEAAIDIIQMSLTNFGYFYEEDIPSMGKIEKQMVRVDTIASRLNRSGKFIVDKEKGKIFVYDKKTDGFVFDTKLSAKAVADRAPWVLHATEEVAKRWQ